MLKPPRSTPRPCSLWCVWSSWCQRQRGPAVQGTGVPPCRSATSALPRPLRSFYGRTGFTRDTALGSKARFAVHRQAHERAVQPVEQSGGLPLFRVLLLAESLTNRFNRMDREKSSGRIEGVTGRLHRNSFHCPVWFCSPLHWEARLREGLPIATLPAAISFCGTRAQDKRERSGAVWDCRHHNIGIRAWCQHPIDRSIIAARGDFRPTEEGFEVPQVPVTNPDKCNVTKHLRLSQQPGPAPDGARPSRGKLPTESSTPRQRNRSCDAG